MPLKPHVNPNSLVYNLLRCTGGVAGRHRSAGCADESTEEDRTQRGQKEDQKNDENCNNVVALDHDVHPEVL